MTRQAEQDLQGDTTKTTPKDDSEKTFTDKLHDTIKAAMTEAMETTMRLLEKYVDEKVTQAVDQMVKFTMTLVNNMIKPPQTQTLQQTANNTAKKLWNKKIQIYPTNNTMDIVIGKLKQGLKDDIRTILSTNPPPFLPRPSNHFPDISSISDGSHM